MTERALSPCGVRSATPAPGSTIENPGQEMRLPGAFFESRTTRLIGASPLVSIKLRGPQAHDDRLATCSRSAIGIEVLAI